MPPQTDNSDSYMSNFVNQLIDYIPNLFGALVILLLAVIVSAVVTRLIASTMGNTPTGQLAQKAAPVIVLLLAVFMIMNQLRIAPEIVTITYGGLVATAVLAFGLGGKDAASKMFLELYETGRKQAKTDTPKSVDSTETVQEDTVEQRAHAKELYSRPE
jgi:carbon starvation protein CstA